MKQKAKFSMKFKVKIAVEIETDWEACDSEDESEIARDLYLYVKDNPIRFLDKTWPVPEIFFVGVTKC